MANNESWKPKNLHLDLTEDEFHFIYYAMLYAHSTVTRNIFNMEYAINAFRVYGGRLGTDNMTELNDTINEMHESFCKGIIEEDKDKDEIKGLDFDTIFIDEAEADSNKIEESEIEALTDSQIYDLLTGPTVETDETKNDNETDNN